MQFFIYKWKVGSAIFFKCRKKYNYFVNLSNDEEMIKNKKEFMFIQHESTSR